MGGKREFGSWSKDTNLTAVVIFASLTAVNGFNTLHLNSIHPSITFSSTSLSSKIAKYDPGSELFSDNVSYVPAGLTEEEYSKIKQKEADKLNSMNFGAWGPRFKPSERPDGDWMVMPKLWTSGTNNWALPTPNVGKASTPDTRRKSPLSVLRSYGPAFILAYVLVDTLAAALGMWKATEMSAMQIIGRLFRLSILQRPKVFFTLAMIKAQAAKLAVVLVLTPKMEDFLERMNRKKLISKRQTVLSSIAISIVSLVTWAGMMHLRAALL